MAISNLIIYNKIENLVNNIKQDPENAEVYMRVYYDALRQHTSFLVKDAVVTMVVSLYQGQIRQLRNDLARCILAGGKDATPRERVELLRCLLGALSLYFGDDYSALTDMCENEINRRISFDEGEEDSEEEELLEP